MPSTRDIRRRIKSIKNTAQITKAMQMVAASKMRRAQDAAMAGRPYAELMNRMLAEVTATATDFQHPLLENRTKHVPRIRPKPAMGSIAQTPQRKNINTTDMFLSNLNVELVERCIAEHFCGREGTSLGNLYHAFQKIDLDV